MESFEVKSQNLTSNYEFKNDSVYVSGSFDSNKAETEVQTIRGDVYFAPTQPGQQRGDYIGNFNGTMGNDGMEYSVSKMNRTKKNMTWAAIDAIEPHIIPVEEEENNENANEE